MKFANLIDEIVAVFSPESGFNRRKFRSAFEATAPGPRTDSWYKNTVTGAQASAQAGALAKVAGDIERNNPWGVKAVRLLTTDCVGAGVAPMLKDERTRKQFAAWARKKVTVGDPELTFSGFQHLIAKNTFSGGEVFVIRNVKVSRGLAFQLKTGVDVDTSKDIDPIREGEKRVINGIEYDGAGERVGYWFKRANGSGYRLPAEDVHHVYLPKFIGQNRGLSEYAPAIKRMNNLDQLEDAQLQQQIVAACLGVFITDKDGIGPVKDEEKAEETPLKISPAMVARLQEGQEIQVVNPPSSLGQNEVTKSGQRGVAAAFGVTYEDLTGDYSAMNLSTMRAARVAYWKWIKVLQEIVFLPLFERVLQWWIALEGGIVDPDMRWAFPSMPAVDPQAEGEAYQRNIRAGFYTPDEGIAESGRDPETHWTNYAAAFKRLDAKGIVLDSDPRKMTAQGQAQVEPKPLDVAPVGVASASKRAEMTLLRELEGASEPEIRAVVFQWRECGPEEALSELRRLRENHC